MNNKGALPDDITGKLPTSIWNNVSLENFPPIIIKLSPKLPDEVFYVDDESGGTRKDILATIVQKERVKRELLPALGIPHIRDQKTVHLHQHHIKK